MTITHNGRTFDLTEQTGELANLRKHLLATGFDGTVWGGVSNPVGRQRKIIQALAYRTAAGQFQVITTL